MRKKVHSGQFAKGFAPHGGMEAHFVDGIFMCEIQGPFNLEFMESYTRMWMSLLAQWPKRKPALIYVFWKKSLLCTPEGFDVLKLSAKAVASKLESHHAWCVPDDIEGRSLVLGIYASAYKQYGVPLYIFNNEKDALNKLKSLI